MKKHKIKLEQETKKLAQDIAKSLKGGEILALEGNLGAGKTTLTRYIGEYFGIKRVTSPTFVLMKVYPIRHKLYAISQFVHIDCYRLDDPQELFYLGIEEYLNRPDIVVIIEWADKIKKYLKKFKKVKWIKITKDNVSSRLIEIK